MTEEENRKTLKITYETEADEKKYKGAEYKILLKDLGVTGVSKLKVLDMKNIYVEKQIERGLKKIRMEEAIKNEKKIERLNLLTAFQLLKKSVRIFNYKTPVFKIRK